MEDLSDLNEETEKKDIEEGVDKDAVGSSNISIKLTDEFEEEGVERD
jgi:hypothetical protein